MPDKQRYPEGHPKHPAVRRADFDARWEEAIQREAEQAKKDEYNAKHKVGKRKPAAKKKHGRAR